MHIRNHRLRSMMLMMFIGILLFNYVNATMFWHSHVVDGRVITHSHIFWKNHVTGNSDGGHTQGQLRLLDVICHTVCTATVIDSFLPERFDVLEYVFHENPGTEVSWCSPHLPVLRGPPAVDC